MDNYISVQIKSKLEDDYFIIGNVELPYDDITDDDYAITGLVMSLMKNIDGDDMNILYDIDIFTTDQSKVLQLYIKPSNITENINSIISSAAKIIRAISRNISDTNPSYINKIGYTIISGLARMIESWNNWSIVMYKSLDSSISNDENNFLIMVLATLEPDNIVFNAFENANTVKENILLRLLKTRE